ncbi:MAG: hypothetical protein ACRDTP_00985 [Mycobacteriales bacterium]
MVSTTRDRMADLERRVATLERGSRHPPARTGSGRARRWWLLDKLAANTGPPFRLDTEAGTASGSLAYGGRVTTGRDGELVWQAEHPLPAVLDADLAAAADVLAALAHPLRLEILRRLLLGARTLAELQTIPDLGTSGQLHHHLRELRTAGLLVHRRNDYAVRPERVVPWLVIVSAALGSTTGGTADDTHRER